MKRKLLIRREAEADLVAAYDWYHERSPGAGERFVAEIDTVVERILAYPNAFPKETEYSRRALLRRFPYGVYFASGEDHVAILGVFHLTQDPAAILLRLKKRRR